jgi:lysozyme
MTLLDQLVRDEGEILHAYKDSLGFLTIGVGHLIDPQKGGGIPKEISRALLQIDIEAAQRALSETYPWTDVLDDVRRDAMVNLTFNLGIGTLSKFDHFLSAMLQGKWEAAKAELLNSLADHQEPARIARLGLQITSGVVQ